MGNHQPPGWRPRPLLDSGPRRTHGLEVTSPRISAWQRHRHADPVSRRPGNPGPTQQTPTPNQGRDQTRPLDNQASISERGGDPLLYVILGRPNPTRYDVMQPGLVTTAPVQREIIRSLRSSRTRLVVRWLDPTASAREHDGAGRSSGVHVLDRYLLTGFRRYARYGDYEVLVAKGSRTIRSR